MRKNKNIILEEVLVESYAAEGKSLARRDGKVIFIEGVVPGDVVDVRLSKNKKDWAEGYPVRFRSFSEERVIPFCQHFGTCGGCQWQMLPYNKQLEYKHQQVHDNLTRIGKVRLPPFEPIIGAAEDRFYRNKLEYTFSTKEYTPDPPKTSGRKGVSEDVLPEETVSLNSEAGAEVTPLLGEPEGAGVLGFHARGFFDKVVHIEKCWLQPEPTNIVRNGIRDFALQNGYTFYDYRLHEGMLRNLMLRICTTGEVMVNVVFGQDEQGKREKLLNYISSNFPQVTTILYTINLKKNDSIFDLEPIVWTGKGYVTEKLGNFEFKIGPKSFFQTNTKQGERLYEVTREFAELDGTQTVYDLYCGTGSIGIFCSAGARKVVGVEAIAAAVLDAEQNASLNNIDHAEFISGDVIDVCNDDFFRHHGFPDVIITDPPRAGMHPKLVQKILDIEAPLVVYVSCNPATQARDLAMLDEKYEVTRVQPVDMFPHTLHIENVVQLKRK